MCNWNATSTFQINSVAAQINYKKRLVRTAVRTTYVKEDIAGQRRQCFCENAMIFEAYIFTKAARITIPRKSAQIMQQVDSRHPYLVVVCVTLQACRPSADFFAQSTGLLSMHVDVFSRG
jgi:hypothetical protein